MKVWQNVTSSFEMLLEDRNAVQLLTATMDVTTVTHACMNGLSRILNNGPIQTVVVDYVRYNIQHISHQIIIDIVSDDFLD